MGKFCISTLHTLTTVSTCERWKEIGREKARERARASERERKRNRKFHTVWVVHEAPVDVQLDLVLVPMARQVPPILLGSSAPVFSGGGGGRSGGGSGGPGYRVHHPIEICATPRIYRTEQYGPCAERVIKT